MKKAKIAKDVTLVGFITASKWDDDDNVTEIKISAEEGDYAIELNDMGTELLDFLDDEVEIIGTLTNNGRGDDRIRVTSYEMLGTTDDDEEDEDYDDDDEADEWEADDWEDDDEE